MAQFEDEYPSLENYWRAIILFGRNVASYKFALAKSLLELAKSGKSSVSFEELAEPFSRHIVAHLAIVDKQSTAPSSKFLDTCRRFQAGSIDHDELILATAKLGFANVIDAYHVVNEDSIPVQFFSRMSNNRGISITDNMFQLILSSQIESLPDEVESRWRLVETAWELNVSRNLVSISHDSDLSVLYAFGPGVRRVDVTSSRAALNGYQKGKCFYCFAPLSLLSGEQAVDVDHFFPHVLKAMDMPGVDGVWNLVLACPACNRGPGGKFAQVPRITYLE